jgi:hypothetical protein
MSSTYPGALDSIAHDKTNATVTQDDHPGHHNLLADAISKIEAELGTDPSGTYATVVARLDAAAGGGADLVYNGSFPANTPYTDGDIVVSNGIAYLCVRPTSAAPTPWAGSRGPQSFYGATPPASPQDGDEWVLPADTTNGVMWKFRYRAGSASAYKWEFVGGASLRHLVPGVETSPGTAGWSDLATINRVTAPRAGDYEIQYGTTWSCSGGATAATYGVGIGAFSSPANSIGMSVYAANVQTTSSGAHVMTCAAGDEIRCRLNFSLGNGNYSSRFLIVRPVRVS